VHLHFTLTYFIAGQINVRVVVFLTIRVYIMIIIKLKIFITSSFRHVVVTLHVELVIP